MLETLKSDADIGCKTPYEVAIVGGGISGNLAAARLSQANPGQRIALLEKEPFFGGRIRSHSQRCEAFGFGLNTISDDLYQFCRQTLANRSFATSEPAAEFEVLNSSHLKRIGVLAAGKLKEESREEWFSPKGARLLGGYSAAKEWPVMSDAFCAKDSQKLAHNSLGQVWKQSRKGAAASVMENMAPLVGITDIWSADLEALRQRCQWYNTDLVHGDFSGALDRLLELDSPAVVRLSNHLVIDAIYKDNIWEIKSNQGVVSARKLIVAHPPWQAQSWLKQQYWPAALLTLTNRTKPTSVVVITDSFEALNVDLPPVILVPAENTQILISGEEISYRATIDFEVSLQAQAAIKAIKRLKRTRRKLLAAFPDIKCEGEHIALVPYAFPQSPAHPDRKILMRSVKGKYNSSHLAFVGDAYGESYDGDRNLISSLVELSLGD